jgi:hypothetical protein
MRRVYSILLAILLIVQLSCATAGKNFNVTMVQEKISIGKSTKGDVVQICGEPLSKNAEAAEGFEVWHYAYVDKNMTAAGILTMTLGVGQEWKSKTTVMDVYFRDNVVVDYRIDDSQVQRLNYR